MGKNSFGGRSIDLAHHPTEPHSRLTNLTDETDQPPPLTDSEESDDNSDDPNPPKQATYSAAASKSIAESELDCNHCAFYIEPPIPMQGND